MTNEEKLELLAEAMDIDASELGVEDQIGDNAAWDSLSMLALMASVSSKTGKKIKPSELLAAVSVQDVLDLIG